ncbi:MAG: hypothetical protein MJE77_33675 [Proteobacteria bacterium]|nr:hypothetical protein [Pseudomonadota bacterium]
MKRHRSISSEELIAAYADKGLEGDERASVEDFLADHPQRRDDVAGVREVVARVRELAPRPDEEPNWERMAANIGRACDDIVARREASWLGRQRARLDHLFRPRYAIALASCAIAVIALIAVLNLGERGSFPDTRETPHLAVDPAFDFSVDFSVLTGEDGLEDVDEADHDQFLARLTGDFTAAPSADDLSADDAALPSWPGRPDDTVVLPADAVVEWATISGGTSMEQQGSDEEFFGEPEYDSWLGELSEEELDALDIYLEGQAG